jgi:hypothetical protein
MPSLMVVPGQMRETMGAWLLRLPLPDIRGPLLALPAPQHSPLILEPGTAVRSEAAAGVLWDVSATLRNPTPSAQPVPMVELVLLGTDGAPVARQRILPARASLAPGDSMAIAAAAIDDQARAVRVALSLRPQGPGRL